MKSGEIGEPAMLDEGEGTTFLGLHERRGLLFHLFRADL